MDLNFRHVRSFVAVAHLKSFTRAATLLHMSQPALTVQIRKLEDSLKIRLLDRNSRSVELTRVGSDLLPLLERTLRDADTIVRETHEQSAGRGGIVRVAALPSFAASLLPKVINQCRTKAPGLNFIVRDAVANRVVELVRNEEVDIGLTGGSAPGADLDVICAGEDRLCVVFPRDHPLSRRNKIAIKDLLELPLVLTDNATSVRSVVEAAFFALGRSPKLVCETTYMMTAVSMVSAGLGVTILPGSAREINAESSLRSVPISDAAFIRPIALIKKHGRTLSPSCEAFARACSVAMGRRA